jgi:hypothetical protein
MSGIATEVYLAYSLNDIPEEALNPSRRHTIAIEGEYGVLACVNAFFMMFHPKDEIDCPYDHMTNEEVMNSIILIPADSFHESTKEGGCSGSLKAISALLPMEQFLEQILTHETLHLVLSELGEYQASRQLDSVSGLIRRVQSVGSI